jgi:methyl-accepting chemotaxis protein
MKTIKILNTEINPLSLRFIERKLEKDFYRYYVNRYIWQLRLAHVLAMLFFVIAVVSETSLLTVELFYVPVRLGIVIPSFIVGLVTTFVFSDFYKKYYRIFSIYYVLITSASFIASGVHAPAPYAYTFFTGIIISLIFNFTFIKQDFLKASITGLIVLAAYLLFAYQRIQHVNHLIHITIYIAVANFLGMFICYAIEWDAKRSFLLLRKTEKDAIQLKSMNENLEHRVVERTKELKKTSDELSEYKEHLENLVEKKTRELQEMNENLSQMNEELNEKNTELESANDELENFNKLFVGREFRIKELKEKVSVLEKKLQSTNK